MVVERPSLSAPELAMVWDRVRHRLERSGLDNRSRVKLPNLSSAARLTLGAVLGRPVRTTVDLASLELALRRLGVGHDLPAALGALGHPVSEEPARRRAERHAARAARDAARTEALLWAEPWSGPWIDEVIRAGGLGGLDAGQAVALVTSVRAVLDRLELASSSPGGDPLSRVDLAAGILGSAHALDAGTRLEAATTRALAHRLGTAEPRDLWEQAGAHLDLTSAPALTWRLPVTAGSGLQALVAGATGLGLPLNLTQLALRRHPMSVPAATDILVVENPRIVEAAAQLHRPVPVVATNGNPSSAVRLLLHQLIKSGARLRYHGDFDVAGLAICGRMAALGLAPWRMDEANYLAAVTDADIAGVDLPTDPGRPPTTPWDPPLQRAFARHRLVVHEERLLPGLLEPLIRPGACRRR